jgi:hypothetical protein
MSKKMNPEVKAKWLSALRSGNFKQTREKLTANNRQSYCCLGVLCELYRQETGNGRWKVNENYDGNYDNNKYAFLGADCMPPDEVIKWAGLPADSQNDVPVGERPRKWGHGVETVTIAGLNDDGKSFAEIADIIESKL